MHVFSLGQKETVEKKARIFHGMGMCFRERDLRFFLSMDEVENRISLGVKKTAQQIQEGSKNGGVLSAPYYIAMTKETTTGGGSITHSAKHTNLTQLFGITYLVLLMEEILLTS